MRPAVGETDLFEQLACSITRRVRRGAGEQRGQLDVLERGQLIDQAEGLEDKPEVMAAEASQLCLGQSL